MQPVAYMSPPAGSPASLVVQGRGATYQPDSSGNYVVTDNQDILALVASGFTIITGQSAIMSMYPQALTGIAPSATINTAQRFRSFYRRALPGCFPNRLISF